jgi:hypothetical protein
MGRTHGNPDRINPRPASVVRIVCLKEVLESTQPVKIRIPELRLTEPPLIEFGVAASREDVSRGEQLCPALSLI